MDGICFSLFIYVFFRLKMPQPPPEVWGSTRRWQGDPHHALRVKTAELMLSAPEGAPLEQSVAATIKDPRGVCNMGVVIAGKHGVPFGHCRVGFPPPGHYVNAQLSLVAAYFQIWEFTVAIFKCRF